MLLYLSSVVEHNNNKNGHEEDGDALPPEVGRPVCVCDTQRKRQTHNLSDKNQPSVQLVMDNSLPNHTQY